MDLVEALMTVAYYSGMTFVCSVLGIVIITITHL